MDALRLLFSAPESPFTPKYQQQYKHGVAYVNDLPPVFQSQEKYRTVHTLIVP